MMGKVITTCVMAAGLAMTAAMAQNTNVNDNYPSYEPGPNVKDGYTAEDLRDAEVRGKNGEKIGDVEDLIIGPNGQLRRLVVSVNEGFFGTGGRRLAVDWNDVSVGPRNEYRIEYVTVPVSKRNVEEYGLFKDKTKAVKGGPREWRATELLGDYISLKDFEDYGSVSDLVFDKQGRLRAIAASPDIDSPVVRFYAPYSGSDKGWDPGDEYYVLPYSQSEISKLLPKTAKKARDT